MMPFALWALAVSATVAPRFDTGVASFRANDCATALAEFVAKHRGRKVTDRLNAVYASEDSRLPRSVRRLQSRSLARETW